MAGESTDQNHVAFPLSLAGGVLILLGGGVSMMSMAVPTGGYPGMMGMMQAMMGSFWFGMMSWAFILGLVSGVMVLLGAIMVRLKPKERKTWGTVIVVFSAISFLGMGGFFIGAVLGIVGGALALS